MQLHAHGALVCSAAVLAFGITSVAFAEPSAGRAVRPFYATPFERVPRPDELSGLGRAAFSDVTLSASGRLSCATCHDPRRAYGPTGKSLTVPGGPDGRRSGFRAIPSLRYLQNVPPFTEHMHDSDGDD